VHFGTNSEWCVILALFLGHCFLTSFNVISIHKTYTGMRPSRIPGNHWEEEHKYKGRWKCQQIVQEEECSL